MTKEEIKKLKRTRYKLREKITNNINKNIKDEDTKKMVYEYHSLTDQLRDAGLNVSIKLDYLNLNYWENVNKPKKSSTQHAPNTRCKSQTPNTHQTHTKHTICLAWNTNETDSKSTSYVNKTIDKIIEYFDDLGLNLVNKDIYNINDRTEHIYTYEYIGLDESFKILKYSSQFLLDTICKTDYENANIAIYCKQNL